MLLYIYIYIYKGHVTQPRQAKAKSVGESKP